MGEGEGAGKGRGRRAGGKRGGTSAGSAAPRGKRVRGSEAGARQCPPWRPGPGGPGEPPRRLLENRACRARPAERTGAGRSAACGRSGDRLARTLRDLLGCLAWVFKRQVMRVTGHPAGRFLGYVHVQVASRVYALPVEARPLGVGDGSRLEPGFCDRRPRRLGILVDSEATERGQTDHRACLGRSSPTYRPQALELRSSSAPSTAPGGAFVHPIPGGLTVPTATIARKTAASGFALGSCARNPRAWLG